jgi:hypothetical protein
VFLVSFLVTPRADGYAGGSSKSPSDMKRILFCISIVTISLPLLGCGVNRKLKITEVQPNQIEIFLDEPASNRLDLTNMKFKWISQDPTAQPASAEVDLGLVGTLDGGKFLMIFEDRNYTGAPVAQNFPGPTAGIKVKNGFFPGYGHNPSVSMGVDGKHYRTYIIFVPVYQDEVNDVVRFGPRPRPALFGTFYEDGSLDGVKPVGSQSVSRTFSGSTPVDTDSESDWSSKQATPAAPN